LPGRSEVDGPQERDVGRHGAILPDPTRLEPLRRETSYGAVMPCDFCGKEFDPISTRWLCPHCHMKANCCDGAPLGV
ncbi:MAG: hypothetical protein WBA97_36335, partial [Actinophytocola sp.]|uniref:hypothetical protein n=1 Tax=Actinophytocola sp. TaxID=1872138 RepID=UPI003C736FF8